MTHGPTRNRRLIAGVLAAAMALTVTPILGLIGTASAADDPPPVAEPIGAGNVCEDVPADNPFTDIQGDNSRDEILCLFHSGITKGATATTYEPGGTLTRRQMALFLKRTADTAEAHELGGNIAALPAYDGTEDYPDIGDQSDEVKRAIGQLSQAEIALGHEDGTYRPNATLKRRQMAKFIDRLIEYLTGDELTAQGDYFDDDEGDSGEEELNNLAELGIFIGDGQGNVNPGGNLSRRQMANILTRTLQVLFADGEITRLFGGPPVIRDVTATTDGSFPGRVDRGDVHRFIFSEPMSNTIDDDDSAYTVEDEAESSAAITCGGAASCNLNQSAVRIGTTEHAAGTVLTVTIDQPLQAFPPLEYPVIVTEVTNEWQSADTTPLDLSSGDTEIEVDEDAPETEQIPPEPVSATHSDDTPVDAATVTFNENVDFIGEASDFTVIANGGVCGDAAVANGTGASVSDDDNDEILDVSFGGDIASGEYELCVAEAAVEDLDGNTNAAKTVPVTFVGDLGDPPVISDVTATTDGSFPGRVDPGDVHRFIFSEPMREAIATDGSAYAIQDGSGSRADVTCGGVATCELNQSAVTIGASEQPAGTVLTVTIDQPLQTLPPLAYPVTITAVTEQWDDRQGTALDLPNSDRVIQVNENAPATVPIPPRPVSATQTNNTPDRLSVRFSERVDFVGVPGDFKLVGDGLGCSDAPLHSGAQVTSDDGDEVLVVTFTNDVTAGQYELCVLAGAVEDLDGNPNPAQTVPASFTA